MCIVSSHDREADHLRMSLSGRHYCEAGELFGNYLSHGLLEVAKIARSPGKTGHMFKSPDDFRDNLFALKA